MTGRMTGHERIRAALIDLLHTVPGIGTLHDYERVSTSPQGLQALYLQGQTIRGFYVRRQSYKEVPYSSTRNKVRTRWVIKGFASLIDADATELAFDRLLDDIAAVVRAKPVLFDAKAGVACEGNALCYTVSDEGAALQLNESGSVMFADVLCHGATFSLITEHLEENERFVSDPNASPGSKDPSNPTPEERQCPYMCSVIDPSGAAAPAAGVKQSL